MQMKSSLEKKRLLETWVDSTCHKTDWSMATFRVDPACTSRTGSHKPPPRVSSRPGVSRTSAQSASESRCSVLASAPCQRSQAGVSDGRSCLSSGCQKLIDGCEPESWMAGGGGRTRPTPRTGQSCSKRVPLRHQWKCFYFAAYNTAVASG